MSHRLCRARPGPGRGGGEDVGSDMDDGGGEDLFRPELGGDDAGALAEILQARASVAPAQAAHDGAGRFELGVAVFVAFHGRFLSSCDGSR